MSFKNPIHESIFNTIIKPTLEKRKLSVQGRIMSMEKQDYAEVYWREPSSGTEMISKNVPLPHVGGGLFSEEMQPGDYVVLEFRNGNYKHPFISAVHGVEGMDIQTSSRNQSAEPGEGEEDAAENGTEIPESESLE